MSNSNPSDPTILDTSADTIADTKPASPFTPTAFVAIGLVGLALGAAFALGLFDLERLPALKPESLAAAEKLWAEKGPAGYNMDLTLEGAQPSLIHVEVRDGVVTAMQRDGLAPQERRTWDYWAVPGMLGELKRELQLAADPQNEMNLPAGTKLEPRAEFDPTYGYPARFHRIVFGTGPEVYWKVTSFKPE
jgi:hypothetical protein